MPYELGSLACHSALEHAHRYFIHGTCICGRRGSRIMMWTDWRGLLQSEPCANTNQQGQRPGGSERKITAAEVDVAWLLPRLPTWHDEEMKGHLRRHVFSQIITRRGSVK